MRRFANDFANHLTRDSKIVIHGNSCFILICIRVRNSPTRGLLYHLCFILHIHRKWYGINFFYIVTHLNELDFDICLEAKFVLVYGFYKQWINIVVDLYATSGADVNNHLNKYTMTKPFATSWLPDDWLVMWNFNSNPNSDVKLDNSPVSIVTNIALGL